MKPAALESRRAELLLHGLFVLTGVVTTQLGPLLPWLQARWAIDDGRAGMLFTAQFVGSMLGIALAGVIVPRLGAKTALVLGVTLMALGTGVLLARSWTAGLAAVGTYGVGLGITIPTTNLVTAAAHPTRRAAALSWMNLAWGVGAVASAPLVAAFRVSFGFRALTSSVAAVLALGCLALTRVGLAKARSDGSPSEASARAPRGFGAALGLLFFLYVGTEAALSGWVAAYVERSGMLPAGGAELTPALFWIPLLAGRGLAPAALRRLSEGRLLAWSLTIAGVGTGGLLVATRLTPVAAGVVLSGLGLAPVFPLLVSEMTRRFGPSAARASAPMFALAALGGATLPGLVGWAAALSGSLRAGLCVPLLGTLGMIALCAAVQRSQAAAPSGFVS